MTSSTSARTHEKEKRERRTDDVDLGRPEHVRHPAPALPHGAVQAEVNRPDARRHEPLLRVVRHARRVVARRAVHEDDYAGERERERRAAKRARRPSPSCAARHSCSCSYRRSSHARRRPEPRRDARQGEREDRARALAEDPPGGHERVRDGPRARELEEGVDEERGGEGCAGPGRRVRGEGEEEGREEGDEVGAEDAGGEE